MSGLENLVTVTIRSTHYYLIDAGQGKLMVDAGWAGSLPELRSQLKRAGISLTDIDYVMITHHHPDHAGLAQEIKRAAHARLILLEAQAPYLESLNAYYAGKDSYVPVQVEPGDLVLGSANRAALNAIGVRGEIVPTPGHSDDSVSLVLDSGMAFTGDLPPPDFVDDVARTVTCESWRRLLSRGVQTVYPAHTGPVPAAEIRRLASGC